MDNYNSNSVDDEVKTSKYNNAIDQIYRLGIIWRNAYKHSSSGNYLAWNFDLDAVWREFAGDLKPESEEDKAFKEINSKINKLLPLHSVASPTFNKVSPIEKKRISDQYDLLMEKEIFLRRLQNQLGKGTAWDDSEDDDF